MMGSTLVLGYDGSDCAKAALRTAVKTAQAFGDVIVVAFGAGVYPSR
jgi:nucleotide-binding universal stress UspA family protein